MDKINRIQNRKKTTTNNEERLRKGAILQPARPGRAFKGLGSATRYCRKDSIGDSFVQPDSFYSASPNGIS